MDNLNEDQLVSESPGQTVICSDTFEHDSQIISSSCNKVETITTGNAICSYGYAPDLRVQRQTELEQIKRAMEAEQAKSLNLQVRLDKAVSEGRAGVEQARAEIQQLQLETEMARVQMQLKVEQIECAMEVEQAKSLNLQAQLDKAMSEGRAGVEQARAEIQQLQLETEMARVQMQAKSLNL
jgi:ATPase subunit of ABC transporter with duplicated ATPase domains